MNTEPPIKDPQGYQLISDDETEKLMVSATLAQKGFHLQYDLTTTAKEFRLTKDGVHWTNGVSSYTTPLDKIAAIQVAFASIREPANSTTLYVDNTIQTQNIKSTNKTGVCSWLFDHTGTLDVGNGFMLANMTGVYRFNTIQALTVNNPVSLYDNSTSGSISIASGARTYVGDVNFATGSATGSGTDGCLLNIGTGQRGIYSDINIGTGLRDSTSNVNIGYCAATGVNNGHVHIQDGNQNAANIHIGNGTNNTGNINIGNGASSSNTINIGTGATGSGSVNLGNYTNTTGYTNISSRNINIGTQSASNTTIYVNNPLIPNYLGTTPTNMGNFTIGSQNSITGGNLANINTTLGSIGDFTLPNGVWMVEITIRFTTWQGGSGDYIRMACNTVNNSLGSTRVMDLSQPLGGGVYIKYNTVMITSASTTIYVMAQKGLAPGTTTTSSILGFATRLA